VGLRLWLVLALVLVLVWMRRTRCGGDNRRRRCGRLVELRKRNNGCPAPQLRKASMGEAQELGLVIRAEQAPPRERDADCAAERLHCRRALKHGQRKVQQGLLARPSHALAQHALEAIGIDWAMLRYCPVLRGSPMCCPAAHKGTTRRSC
jgi:hypothetical protein